MTGAGISRPREKLALVAHAGELHAGYPTAERTLCGIPLGHTVRVRGPEPPSCSECYERGELFDSVDKSAPLGWYRQSCV